MQNAIITEADTVTQLLMDTGVSETVPAVLAEVIMAVAALSFNTNHLSWFRQTTRTSNKPKFELRKMTNEKFYLKNAHWAVFLPFLWCIAPHPAFWRNEDVQNNNKGQTWFFRVIGVWHKT